MINAEDRMKLFVDSIAAEAETTKGKKNSIVRMIVLVIAYCLILIVSIWNPHILIKGVVSELQVLIAVYLTIREGKKGFYTALVLATIALAESVLLLIQIENLSLFAIILNTLFIWIICSLIYYFSTNLRKRTVELEQQNWNNRT